MPKAVHLKFFETARIALQDHGGPIEHLPTRYDQHRYDGGLMWGTKGTGSLALATAIAGWYACHIVHNSDADIAAWGVRLVENLIADLDPDSEHTITPQDVKAALER